MKPIICILTLILTLSMPCSCQVLNETPFKPADNPLIWIYTRYYQFDKEKVFTLVKYLGNYDDVSVCLYLAKKTGMDPQDIMGLRRMGKSLNDILKTLSYPADQLFFSMGTYDVFGVPACFKHAYGEYKKWQQNPSYVMDLTDDDIRNMVQIHLALYTAGRPAITLMRERNSGRSWEDILIK
jgi:hypothetical protein